MGSTHTRTWVYTVLVNTGKVAGTFRITDTLRFTFNIWIANIVTDTSTRSCLVAFCTLSIDTTRRWIAWLDNLNRPGGGCCWIAHGERISIIVTVAGTDGHVISYAALRIYSTSSGAWVKTFLILACHVLRTIRVDDTFWTAVGRVANHTWQARTVTTVAITPGWAGVVPAGVRYTGILCNYWFND